ADDSGDLTGTGDVVGTLRFMAPERFQGKADARSDVYSLGVTLYEMAALQPAFPGTDRFQLMEQGQYEVPRRPRQSEAGIPRDLETVICKALARSSEQRYPTAHALADDLRRFLDGMPIQARRSSWLERAWRRCRRNPLVISLTAVI